MHHNPRNFTRLCLSLTAVAMATAIHLTMSGAGAHADGKGANLTCVIACNPRTKLCNSFNVWGVPSGYIRLGSSNTPAGYRRVMPPACNTVCGNAKTTACKP